MKTCSSYFAGSLAQLLRPSRSHTAIMKDKQTNLNWIFTKSLDLIVQVLWVANENIEQHKIAPLQYQQKRVLRSDILVLLAKFVTLIVSSMWYDGSG